MGRRYHVSTYRSPLCSKPDCDRYGTVIPINYSYVKEAEVGTCWRSFCKCGDGAGWRLDSVEWIKNKLEDEIIVNMKIELNLDSEQTAEDSLTLQLLRL